MTIENKYLHHNPQDLKVAINTIKKMFSDENQKANAALNSPNIRNLENLQAMVTALNTNIVAVEIMQLITLVKMYRNTTIPNSVKALDDFLKNESFTDKEKAVVELLEKAGVTVHRGIDLLDQLSTPEGQLKLMLKANGLTQ